MKIIDRREKPKITLDDLSAINYIGVEFGNGGRAYVEKIAPELYILSNFYSRNNDYSSKVQGGSIKGLIKKVGTIQEVLVFDTPKELGEFLMEKL